MAELTLQQITEDGITATYSTADAGGDTADNTGNTFLHIKNAAAGSMTVTITAQTTSVENQIYGTLTKSNASVVVGASGEAFIGPFKQAAFNDGNSEIAITYSTVESVTIAALYI